MTLTPEDKQWIAEHVTGQITEHLEKLETKLLTAFHQWASPTESRVRSLSSGIHALDLDVENLKGDVESLKLRINKLEGKQPSE